MKELKKDTNVILNLTFGGMPAEQDLEIRLLDQAGKAVFVGTWGDLEEKTDSASCSSMHSMIDNFDETLALICDNEIDFSVVVSAEATNSAGKTRHASSIDAIQVYDDTMQVFVALF